MATAERIAHRYLLRATHEFTALACAYAVQRARYVWRMTAPTQSTQSLAVDPAPTSSKGELTHGSRMPMAQLLSYIKEQPGNRASVERPIAYAVRALRGLCWMCTAALTHGQHLLYCLLPPLEHDMPWVHPVIGQPVKWPKLCRPTPWCLRECSAAPEQQQQ